ncbi:MAG: type I restriction enzyme HsdR N-terminal domain-containing protein [Pedobacter agri]
MDRKAEIKKLASRIKFILPHVQSGEFTENVLVMPFIQILGFDADQVREDTRNTTLYKLKKTRRPSYTIFKGDRMNLLVECAHHHEKLEDFESSLSRYWQKTKANYAMLTNGIEYRIYSSAMMRINDFSKPLLGFHIDRTPAGLIDKKLQAHKGLLN